MHSVILFAAVLINLKLLLVMIRYAVLRKEAALKISRARIHHQIEKYNNKF